MSLFTAKDWRDADSSTGGGDESTPLSAGALEDLETRLATYSESVLPFYDVFQYGALGDGTTDDLAAIQSAVDAAGAAGGGVVYFPLGTFALSDTLEINYDNVTLLGANWTASKIICDSGYAAITHPLIDATNGGTGVSGFGMQDLWVEPFFAADTAIAVDYDSAAELNFNMIQRCRVRAYYKTGILLGQNGNEVACHVQDCFIDGTGTTTLHHSSQCGIWVDQGAGSMKFFDNRINNNRDCGIRIEGGGNQLQGNHIFGHGSAFSSGSTFPTCVKILRGSLNSINNNYFDNCRQNHMIVLATDTVGQAMNDTQVNDNTFICAATQRNATDSGNSNYSVVGIDSTTASIANVQIDGNIGNSTSTTPWTNIVDFTATNASIINVVNNMFRNVEAVSDNATLIRNDSGNQLYTSTGSLIVTGGSQKVDQYTVNHTLTIADIGVTLEMNSTGALTVTVPPNATVPFPIGTTVEVIRFNTGSVTLVAGAGVSLFSPSGSLAITTRYGTATLIKRATNEWVVGGLV